MSNISGIFDDIIEDNLIKQPVAILKEFAQELNKTTKGLLIARVIQEDYDFDNPHELGFQFLIVAPSLNNYSYEVLTISHDPGLYPLSIVAEEKNRIQILNQESFEEELKRIFSSPKIKRIINGLLATSKTS